MTRLMVIAPHCDDAELGCAGYMAKTIDDGGEVIVVIATVGDIHFLHRDEIVDKMTRIEEFKAAIKVLGVKDYMVVTFDYEAKLNTFPSGNMVKALDQAQDEWKPDEVLIPLPSAHQDHKYMWDVSVAATRPSPAKHMPTLIAAYEYPSTSWGEGAEVSSFRGGMYVDIGAHIDQKMKCLDEHKSQMRDGDHLISTEAVKALARIRGLEAGFQYAELFQILRLRVNGK